ncbi:MAG: mannonate dehydratase [Pseudomonadota bacterium]
MRQAWRWFGPDDPVSLEDVRQAGATEIVTALHHIPIGAVWPQDEIDQRRAMIEKAGLRWSVVESIPVTEPIKTRTGPWREHQDNWAQSLRSVAKAGVEVVCYNFMPVIDWTRTELDYRLPDGALALRFDVDAFAAFDLFILKRANAEVDWDVARQARARTAYDAMSDADQDRLTKTIIAGLPGTDVSYTLDNFKEALAPYREIDAETLRTRLIEFIKIMAPIAAEAGVKLSIHPDDPPRPLLGLPRVMSVASDAQALLDAVPEPANGVCFCTGSFGARPDNDLPAMARQFGLRIHFAHLRNTKREADPETFHESAHLEGDTDMVAVIKAMLDSERATGRTFPMRPDHGHRLLDDQTKETRPGYPAIGRLRGLAELRGIMHTLERLN